jgi:hypothetical protein
MTIERPLFPPRAAPSAIPMPLPFGAVATVIQFPTRRPGNAMTADEFGQAYQKLSLAERQAVSAQVGRAVELTSARLPTLNKPLGGISADISLNERLRGQRREAWWKASAKAEIWRARLEMHDRVAIAQKYQLPEVLGHPPVDHKDRDEILRSYREARVALMLTPVPSVGELLCKKRAFEQGDHVHIGMKPELIEKAIADDEAFLKAHPTRHCRHRPAKALAPASERPNF